MAGRRIGLVLTLSFLGGLAVALPAEAACAPPRISLTGFAIPEGPRLFYLGNENTATAVGVLISGGCNGAAISADFATSPGTALRDFDYVHASSPPRISATPPNDGSELVPQSVSILDDEQEPLVEWLQFTLSNPQATGGAGVPTLVIPSAPILIVDSDGQSRVGFEGLPYSQSETFLLARIPVFWAGVGSPPSVQYTVEPGPTNPATQGEDYTVTSPSTLTFGSQRLTTIDLAIINDTLGEAPEDVTITLQNASGGALIEKPQMTFTIEDNEENVAPTSRFHHPRHKWKYRKSDYRIREFHIFFKDNPGGSGVVAAELALRRKLKNGTCAWKAKKGWQRKACDNPTWLPTKYDETGDLFYYRMPQLKPSVDTRIKNYTAFSRAIDGAGNVEKDFVKKRNDNTFEIRRKGKTKKA
jgi:hypothetical protein